MLTRLATIVAITLAFAEPAFSQVPATDATIPQSGTAAAPAGTAGTLPVTPLPGVTDPTTTNSTTGTVDHEDHCQPPGTPGNTNPSADALALPRPEQACR